MVPQYLFEVHYKPVEPHFTPQVIFAIKIVRFVIDPYIERSADQRRSSNECGDGEGMAVCPIFGYVTSKNDGKIGRVAERSKALVSSFL